MVTTALCALLVALIVLAASAHHGLAVTPDSVSYLHAADDLTDGRSPTDARGAAFVGWPPLYPALVAATSFVTARDALDAARLVNATLVVALLIVFAAAARRLVRDTSLQVVGVLAIALSPTVFLMAGSALSELLFSVLVLSALWATVEGRRHPDARRVVLCAAALAAGAALARYVGVIVIGVGAVSLLPRRRVAAWYTLVAATPLAAWLAHNRLAAGTLTGRREGDGAPLGDTIRTTAETAGRWLAPGNPRPLVFGGAGLTILALAVIRARRAALPTGGSALPLCLFVGCYPAALALLALAFGIDPVSSRLLAPLWPPALLVVLIATSDLLAARAEATSGRDRKIVLLGAATWMLAAATLTAHDAAHLRRNGAGYASARWDQSGLVEGVTSLPATAAVVSNAPYALAFRTGRPATGVSEGRPGAYLAWFDDPERSRDTGRAVRDTLRTVADQTRLELRLDRTLDDGQLFRVRTRPLTDQ